MYDPAVQRAVLEKLARWRQLPEGDLIAMLSPVERLRFRPEALDDLEWDGFIEARVAGDERMVSITEAGEAYLELWAGSLEQYRRTMDMFFRLYTGRSPDRPKGSDR